MPVVYRCGGCGAALYVYKGGAGAGLLPPSAVIARYGGRCPACGKRLEPPSLSNIKIVEARSHGQEERRGEGLEP